jgi:hypothetical protein
MLSAALMVSTSALARTVGTKSITSPASAAPKTAASAGSATLARNQRWFQFLHGMTSHSEGPTQGVTTAPRAGLATAGSSGTDSRTPTSERKAPRVGEPPMVGRTP